MDTFDFMGEDDFSSDGDTFALLTEEQIDPFVEEEE